MLVAVYGVPGVRPALSVNLTIEDPKGAKQFLIERYSFCLGFANSFDIAEHQTNHVAINVNDVALKNCG